MQSYACCPVYCAIKCMLSYTCICPKLYCVLHKRNSSFIEYETPFVDGRLDVPVQEVCTKTRMSKAVAMVFAAQ